MPLPFSKSSPYPKITRQAATTICRNAIHFCRHSRAVASIHKEMNYKKQVIMSSEESGSGYRQKRV